MSPIKSSISEIRAAVAAEDEMRFRAATKALREETRIDLGKEVATMSPQAESLAAEFGGGIDMLTAARILTAGSVLSSLDELVLKGEAPYRQSTVFRGMSFLSEREALESLYDEVCANALSSDTEDRARLGFLSVQLLSMAERVLRFGIQTLLDMAVKEAGTPQNSQKLGAARERLEKAAFGLTGLLAREKHLLEPGVYRTELGLAG